MYKTEETEVLNKTEARQGYWDKPVMYVLCVSLLLAFIGLGVTIFASQTVDDQVEATRVGGIERPQS